MKLQIAAVFTSLAFNASTAQEMSYGQAEYLNSCAVDALKARLVRTAVIRSFIFVSSD